MTVRLVSVIGAAEPSAWAEVGFAIEGDLIPFGNGAIENGGAGHRALMRRVESGFKGLRAEPCCG